MRAFTMRTELSILGQFRLVSCDVTSAADAAAGLPVRVRAGRVPVPQRRQGGALPDRPRCDLPHDLRQEDRKDYRGPADRLPGGHPADHRRGRCRQRPKVVRGQLPDGHPGGHPAQPVRLLAGLRLLQADVQDLPEGLPLRTAEGHHLRSRHAGFRSGCNPGSDLLCLQPDCRRAVHLLLRVAQHLWFHPVQLVAQPR